MVFSEFSRPESSKSPLPRVSGLDGGGLWVACASGVFGVFTARKLKITTPARFWPGRRRLAGGVREWCFRNFRGQKTQNHHSRAFLAWKGQACGWRAGVVFSEFSRPESSKSPLPRVSGLEGGGLRVKAQNHHSRASLAWKGKACGWRAGVVFSEFSRPESSKSPLPRVSGLEEGGMRVACESGVFGVFAARKLKITTPARLWPGRGRLACGVREWCFWSFHGQKAQNHHSRAFLAWKGQACGWRAGVVFSEFSRPESSKTPLPRVFGLEGGGLRVACGSGVFGVFTARSSKSPLPRVSGLEGGVLRVACGSGVFGVFTARKLKTTTPARLWPGSGEACGWRAEIVFSEFSRPESSKSPLTRVSALEGGGLRVACGSGVFGVFTARKLKITFHARGVEGRGLRVACGSGVWVVCGSGVFGVFTARKLKIITPARLWPGRGRLVGGVREWCFRSFRGQKAQNHHSHASLAWKGQACGLRAGVAFSEFSRPESSKSPLPCVSGLEGRGLRVACGSGVFGVFTASKLKITTFARLWPGLRLRSLNNLFPGRVFESGSGFRLGFLAVLVPGS